MSSDRRPKASRRATAIHEAGHAVVAHHFGHRIISIRLRKDRTGYVRREQEGIPCPVEWALICLAGDAAEYRARTLPRRLMSRGDSRNMERAGFGRRAVLGILRPEADKLMRKLWPRVVRLAKNLESRTWPVTLYGSTLSTALEAP